MEQDIFIELWRLIKSHTAEKDRAEVAHQFVAIFEDSGIDVTEFEDVHGECKHLDAALEELGFDDGDEEEDE